MSRALRLGFVGCGDIAQFLAWFARLNRGIRLAGCCDLSPERVAAFGRRFRVPHTYTSYEQMLDEGIVDAVYLAVPHHLHYEMLERAIRAGLPVFIEKPVTRTLDEGNQIAQLAQERGVRVAVNYQFRYDGGCYALARAVQGGALGRVHYARCNIPWHREAAYFEGAGWHASLAQAGGGTLITQASHYIDVLLWALGGRPRAAAGMTAQRKFKQVEVEDLAQGIVEMEDGALVQISSSMVATPEQAVTMEVYGERGTALYAGRPWPHVRFRGVRVKKERPPVWGVHALQRSLEAFRAWVVDGQPHLVPAAEALPVLAAVEAVYRSARSGHREEIQ